MSGAKPHKSKSDNIKDDNIKSRYIPVPLKFWIGHVAASLWMLFSIYVSVPWIRDLGSIISIPLSVIVIAGIGYIPGYIFMFMVVGLLLDRQPKFKTTDPKNTITIVIACHNEEAKISETLRYVSAQDYKGHIKVIVVDNASSDHTAEAAKAAAEKYNLDFKILYENNPGKFNALNYALRFVDTDFLITLDADTLLHKSAVRYLVSRMVSAPKDVCAVAGAVLVRNSRENFITRIQEWDYFLGITSIKRLQGLYQSTLVAQGAYSLYMTEVLREIGGWPDAIGEDIVLTWKIFATGKKVFFEPSAVAFTDVPTTLKHLIRQRSRWARGMIEALKQFKTWRQPSSFVRYLTGINLIMPYLDTVYTFFWIPGLVLALFGRFWIVGPVTLFVIPLALFQVYILYKFQKQVFNFLKLGVRRNIFGFIFYVLFYQIIMSPISVYGYLQEILSLKRKWK
ncbi:MAG: glycosyltransferase family 2 protein [Clostridiales bacterium]|nr:glycosyltransferase family 2 protein [Clostridiales bacterium]